MNYNLFAARYTSCFFIFKIFKYCTKKVIEFSIEDLLQTIDITSLNAIEFSIEFSIMLLKISIKI
ncbi:hypothetical protein [Clostridium paridis]|uniref:hypothetical protein n=1 Tax=Clostridium paridis TaxID=2803863 RepID=UPI00192C448A|nr:hypothetical protein [Clostridium paridis]